jgi:hypothetical protein
MSPREGRRYQTIRRTGKPHIYLENGEWLVLEKTAPGEWWLSPLHENGSTPLNPGNQSPSASHP